MEDTAAARGPEVEPPAARRMRHIGLALLLVALFFPYYGCRAQPGDFRNPPERDSAFGPDKPALVPVLSIAGVVGSLLSGDRIKHQDVFRGSLNVGWFVFFPLPLWLLAAWAARKRGLRVRRFLGVLFWLVGLGVQALAAIPLLGKSGMFSPDIPLAQFGIWSIGLACLLARPRGRWGLSDLEAALSTHALLGLAVILLNPVWEFVAMFLDEPADLLAIVRAQWANYLVGFWVTLLALMLIALPLYVPTGRFQRIRARLRARFAFLPAGLETETAPVDG